MRTPRRALAALSLILAPALAPAAALADGHRDDVRSAWLGQHRVAAGQTVTLGDEGMATVFAAGETVTLARPASGDAHLAGRAVTVDAPIGGDAYAAGADVAVNARVDGQLWAAGRAVSLSSGADVLGDAALAGESVRLDGAMGGDVWAAGETVTLGGVVAGDLTVRAESLFLAPGARVAGGLTVHSPNAPDIPDGAVDGPVTHVQDDWRADWRGDHRGRKGFGGVMGPVAVAASLLAIALALVGWGRGLVECGAAAARERFWGTLGMGAVTLAVLLLAIVAAMATVVGAPLGALMALAMPLLFAVALTLGAVAAGLALWRWRAGNDGPDGFWRRALLALGSVAVYLILAAIPFVGFLLTVVLLLVGLGVLLRGARHAMARDC